MPKRTFQPKKRKRKRTHGFRVRMKSPGARSVLKARRAKGRGRLSADKRSEWAKNHYR